MNNIFTPFQKFLINWLLIILTAWLTWSAIAYIGEQLGILVTAALIAFLLNYPVKVLQAFLPRTLAAGLVYLLAAIAIALIALIIVPPIFDQARQLTTNFPDLVESARVQVDNFQLWSADHNLPFDLQNLTYQLLERIQAQAQAIAAKGLGLVLGTVNWFVDLILIVVISFYMLIDGERVWGSFTSIFSPLIREALTEALQRNLQRFLSGQLLLGLFMAVTLSLAFWVLGVPFFLVFAVFIGLMEVIPFVGASLGIATVVIVVAFINWLLALQVLAVAIALQQIKDNLVAPRIMGNLTGLSPVIIFVALLLGAKLGGLLGVILAIPLTGVFKSVAEIVSEPTLPPQTGSFFNNPFDDDKEVLVAAAAKPQEIAPRKEE